MKTKYIFIMVMACYARAFGQNLSLGNSAGNAGNLNTSIGNYAGDIVTGYGNTFLGHASGRYVTTANNNAFFGAYTGYNTTGNNNVFFGYTAGYQTTTGYSNIFVGNASGYSNVGGIGNVFVGDQSGYNNTSGYYCAFVGHNAGINNTTGGTNCFIGHDAGRANTTGGGNCFVGSSSGVNNIDGIYNTFVGEGTGTQGTHGSYNTVLGAGAGGAWLGNLNVFVGENAGVADGDHNLCIGSYAGSMSEGADNVFIGYYAGSSLTASQKFIVSNVQGRPPLLYGDFSTGQLGVGTSTLGNYALSVNGTAYATGMWLSSDKRFKENESQLSGSLDKLSRVQGVNYNFAKNEHARGRTFDEGKQIGFIAQDLREVFPELVKENSDGYLAVNYSGMVPVLVEALKELRAEVSAMKARLEDAGLNSKIQSTVGAYLGQNVPNPSHNVTTINYSLPEEATDGYILITDLNGKQFSKIDRLNQNAGEISITPSQYPPGVYLYSLVVGGRVVDTKKMVIEE